MLAKAHPFTQRRFFAVKVTRLRERPVVRGLDEIRDLDPAQV
jgi:hypothetical protein